MANLKDLIIRKMKEMGISDSTIKKVSQFPEDRILWIKDVMRNHALYKDLSHAEQMVINVLYLIETDESTRKLKEERMGKSPKVSSEINFIFPIGEA